MKDTYKERFPPGFLNRPKAGFSVPLQRWFSTDLEGFAKSRICNAPLKDMDLVNLGTVRQVIEENKGGKRDHGELIWKLLVLSEWVKHFA